MPRVLLVDDDPDYRLLAQLVLASTPFQVVAEARDGREAVEAAAACRPDLVLLDCSMPGSDAFDALAGLRRAVAGCRVILLSGHAPGDLRLAARSAGALGFLGKDTPPTRLADELAALAGLVDAIEGVLVEASTRLERDPRSTGAARRFVAGALEPWRPGPLLDTVTLLVSELVTNAVVHAGSEVDVVVQLTEHAARVEVTDRSDAPPAPRTLDDWEDSGRGLWLLETMAHAWGVRPVPGGGKIVWFEVVREGACDPAGLERVGNRNGTEPRGG